MIEAVVFDLDGVLIDSEPVWERVRRGLVSERGGHWAADAQKKLMGMSTPEWARYLSEDLGVGLPPGEVAELVTDRMAASYREHLPLLPGAVEAVRRLAARWPLGLASSAPAVLIETVLESAGLRPDFQVTMSTEQVPRGKPAPDIYLAVADRLGVAPASMRGRGGLLQRPALCRRRGPARHRRPASPVPARTLTPSPRPAWSCPAWPGSPRRPSFTACEGTPEPARR